MKQLTSESLVRTSEQSRMHHSVRAYKAMRPGLVIGKHMITYSGLCTTNLFRYQSTTMGV